MASASSFVSQEEFILFHTIDRELYKILVINLSRDPAESMQILALCLWLERVGFRNVVKKILSLPIILINEVADEAITCLNCINNGNILISEGYDIPLLQSLMDKEISLLFLHENGAKAIEGVAKMVQDVCVRALTDIMPQVVEVRNSSERMVTPAAAAVADRTMFVTFSKGYPVLEWEVREFVTRTYGDCIEALYMQEVQPNEQALFARIVFHLPSTIDTILKGATKAKFIINGKHVWARKFVPKGARNLLPPHFAAQSSGL